MDTVGLLDELRVTELAVWLSAASTCVVELCSVLEALELEGNDVTGKVVDVNLAELLGDKAVESSVCSSESTWKPKLDILTLILKGYSGKKK